MKRIWVVLLFAAVAWSTVVGQEPGTRVPTVELAPVGKVQVKAGGSATAELDFRVANDFHINSSKPHSELLIPTVLQLTPPDNVTLGAIKYPPGQDQSFPFAPNEKLSVYSGDFSISVPVKASATALSGNYSVTGQLRFQA